MEARRKVTINSAIFYASFMEAGEMLPDADRLSFYDAIFEYAFTGTVREMTKIANALFITVKPQMDVNRVRYQNGCKGGRPRNQKVSEEQPNGNQTETETKPNQNQSITEIVDKSVVDNFGVVGNGVDNSENAIFESSEEDKNSKKSGEKSGKKIGENGRKTAKKTEIKPNSNQTETKAEPNYNYNYAPQKNINNNLIKCAHEGASACACDIEYIGRMRRIAEQLYGTDEVIDTVLKALGGLDLLPPKISKGLFGTLITRVQVNKPWDVPVYIRAIIDGEQNKGE